MKIAEVPENKDPFEGMQAVKKQSGRGTSIPSVSLSISSKVVANNSTHWRGMLNFNKAFLETIIHPGLYVYSRVFLGPKSIGIELSRDEKDKDYFKICYKNGGSCASIQFSVTERPEPMYRNSMGTLELTKVGEHRFIVAPY